MNLETPRRVLNSLWRVKKILFQKKDSREGKNQNIKGKNNIPSIVLNQFIDRLIILVEGSKIENKFIIIFKIKNYCYY